MSPSSASGASLSVLQVAHAWDKAEAGGAQRSAVALSAGLRRIGGVDCAVVSCVPAGRFLHPHAYLGLGDDGSVLIASQTDHENFKWSQPSAVDAWADLLSTRRPDVVHLHHVLNAGIDLPALVRRILPSAAVVLTLHEFLVMCPRSGQMLHRDGHLCREAGTLKCSDCMQWSPARTAARAAYMRTGLDSVDAFVSPSHFLLDRFVRWGIGRERITRIPNVVEATVPVSAQRDRRTGGPMCRIVFIGQHTPTKGLDVLLQAAATLKSPDGLRVDIYGGGAERFGPQFADHLNALAATAYPTARLHGPYDNRDLDLILADADFVVVPSTWWENSPVVIQEAFARGIPVIASDIGGMREQVDERRSGLLFRAGDVANLADTLLLAASMVDHAWVPRPDMAPAAAVRLHVELYEKVLSARAT